MNKESKTSDKQQNGNFAKPVLDVVLPVQFNRSTDTFLFNFLGRDFYEIFNTNNKR